MEPYISIKKESSTVNLEEKKSKFIGNIFKIETEQDAKEILQTIRKQYNDARHNCYGYITLDGKIKRYSDDGEPQKTAGVPILDVIEKNNLVGVLIIVTRYFGGTLLGTGGLVKMYGGTAVKALEEAEITPYIPFCIYEISIPYNLKPKLDNIFENENFKIVNEDFTDKITLQVQLLREKTDSLINIMNELSNGQITPILLQDDIMCPAN